MVIHNIESLYSGSSDNMSGAASSGSNHHQKGAVASVTDESSNSVTSSAYDGLRAVDDDDDEEDRIHQGHHPAIRTVCVVDTLSADKSAKAASAAALASSSSSASPPTTTNNKYENIRIVPNGPPVPLDNECFHGHVMLLMRTPDVDNARDPALAQMSADTQRISSYFKGKKRRFEFQFQVKLKRVPTGPLFLGCELEHPVKVGSITRGLVGLLLAMVRRINPGFHYSWGPTDTHGGKSPATIADLESGNYEKTHLSFPVEASMDRIVITKPGRGDAIPTLGHELFESNESVKRRRRIGSGSVDWNTEDTYTMCLWSAYCDWIKWKSLNVPGVSPFSLTRVTGVQPIYLSVYEIAGTSPEEYRRTAKTQCHLRNKMNIYTRLEFSNLETTAGGVGESLYTARLKKKQQQQAQKRGGPLGGMAGGVGGSFLGSRRLGAASATESLPDTESVGSDFETTSRISHLTIN